jgi:hypothetical protein
MDISHAVHPQSLLLCTAKESGFEITERLICPGCERSMIWRSCFSFADFSNRSKRKQQGKSIILVENRPKHVHSQFHFLAGSILTRLFAIDELGPGLVQK